MENKLSGWARQGFLHCGLGKNRISQSKRKGKGYRLCGIVGIALTISFTWQGRRNLCYMSLAFLDWRFQSISPQFQPVNSQSQITFVWKLEQLESWSLVCQKGEIETIWAWCAERYFGSKISVHAVDFYLSQHWLSHPQKIGLLNYVCLLQHGSKKLRRIERGN